MPVLEFPKCHVRTASGASIPNTLGQAILPNGRKACAKIMDFSGAIRPRDRQLLTPGAPMPASSAALNVPPTASKTSSTVSKRVPSGVCLIPPNTSLGVNMSSLHNAEIFTGGELRPNTAMSRALKDIAKRLEMTRGALGISAAQIARDTTISANEWSQYINPDKYKRRISVEHVYELKDTYGATLEWIYDGDVSSLRGELAAKVRAMIKSAA